MPLYRYVKQQPAVPKAITLKLPSLSIPSYIPTLLMGFGLVLLLSVLGPIVYHELITYPRLKRTAILSPLPVTAIQIQQLNQVAGVSTYVQNFNPPPRPQSDTDSDLTQANNWFPTAPIENPNPSKITHYTIDIPKLNVFNAVVAIGGSDLKSSLVQYAQTSNPGEFGAPVIFGHSILRQFYNPSLSNPKRYISIFSTIMTLKSQDEIIVHFDGIDYTYQVTDKYEVKPDQVEVLQQRFDSQSLKLITCTPEGTYLRRGVVEATLKSI